MTAFGSKPADLAMPAALFFDVDGTLVWHDPDAATGENIVSNPPSAEVYKAFHALADNGHKAFICTGRPLSLVAQDLLDLKPAGLITGAGATIDRRKDRLPKRHRARVVGPNPQGGLEAARA
ncbi:MAG: HAD hydrolase family protein [Collinsella aerofaciens]